MTSTERAPEPTMEEILASIRRIISDDESNAAARKHSASPSQEDETLEAVEGEADDKIISDIAQVLSGGASPAEEEEDILDLTAELGGLEPVEETFLVEAAMEETPAEVVTPEVFQPAPESPEPQAEAVSAPQPEMQDWAPEPVTLPPPLSAGDEAASALDRAIAALRAGQLPTSMSEFMAQPMPQSEPMYAPEPPALAVEPEPEPETELLLTEFEIDVIADAPPIAEPVESEPQKAPAWEAEAPSFAAAVEREAEFDAPRTNGGGTHPAYAEAPMSSPMDASARTLEDSIKDMLRPMLRQWLDENMARVLTTALKDELRDNPARFERD
jgi:uncharacterized protein